MGHEGLQDKNKYAFILPDEENLKTGLYSLVDFSRPVFYFPIRHHSPVCSYFLIRTIEEYAPDCILIEGPEDANELKDVLVSEELKTPVAIYYSFRDKKGLISGNDQSSRIDSNDGDDHDGQNGSEISDARSAREGDEPQDYRCYYPFLDYSPELVALREGARRSIPASFFDLGYAEILYATAEGRGLRKDREKVTYNDDSYLSESTFMKKLVEHASLPNFDAFWEKYFEVGALSGSLEEFLKSMLLYCGMCRTMAPREELLRDGCLAREAHMRKGIREASEKYQRILVVTGGFHTPGLAFSGENGDFIKESTGASAGERKDSAKDLTKDSAKDSSKDSANFSAFPRSSLPKEDKGVYVMPYSMEAADALNGYASGMPFPAFYQSVWERLSARKNAEPFANSGEKTVAVSKKTAALSNNYADTDTPVKVYTPTDVYTPVVVDHLVKVGRAVRRKDGATSTADEITALMMAENLASLRGKEAPGAFELSDAVLSSFVKGEVSPASALPITELKKLLTGTAVGKLPENAKLPPLFHDFEEKCRSFRLDLRATVKKEVTLQIFAKERHRMESAFFHCMVFLGSDFASRKRGPNLHTGMDRNLIREIWEYKWSTAISGILIENSVYGGTVEEACKTLVSRKMHQARDAAEAAGLLLSAFEMGLEISPEMIHRLQECVQADSDFFSLTQAFSSVSRLGRLDSLYRSRITPASLKDTLFGKILSLLPGMAQLKDEDLEDMLSALRELYYEAQRPEGFSVELKDTQKTSDLTESSDTKETRDVSNLSEVPKERQRYTDLLDVLKLLSERSKIHPGLLGAVQGILYSAGELEANAVCFTAKGFLSGTGEEQAKIASYLRGLFYNARDILFSSEELLEMLDIFLGEASADAFLKLLPQLRLAFGSFTPRETDRIAEQVADRYGVGAESLRKFVTVSARGFEYGRSLDERITALLEKK